ncbi:dodecin family protein [Lentisalinibacter sediminis]|uniref:dodecin family protein n=1 Tax=Lentisalinibacter sediminis TaxID=2992237 RepID=UPI003865CDF8
MSVVKVTEIMSDSKESFEDAINDGIARASKTVHNIQSAWIKEQKVVVKNDKVAEYRVAMKVSFLVDDK